MSNSRAWSSADDDDTAALLAELDRIKKERAEEAARKEATRAQAEMVEKQQAVAGGNPLLHLRPDEPADFSRASPAPIGSGFHTMSRGIVSD